MRILLYLFAILFGLSFWYQPTHDPDLGWHLLGGSWIATHGEVPREDIINTFGASWIDYHWLAQLLFYKVYSWGGFEGLRLTLGLFMAALSALVLLLVEKSIKSKEHPLIIFLTFFIAIYVISFVTSIRPQMLALFLLVLSLLIVKGNLSILTKLLTLFIFSTITANIHVYWIFIPFLWLLYIVIPRFVEPNKSSLLFSWGGFLILCFSGFISPYGLFTNDPTPGAILANYVVIYDYILMPHKMRELINEMRPALSGAGSLPYILLFCVAVVFRVATAGSIKKHFGDWLGAIVSFVLTLRTLKFVSIFGVLGIPLLSDALSKFLTPVLEKRPVFEKKLTLAILAIGMSYLSIHIIMHRPWYYDNSFYNDENLPVRACARIKNLNLVPKYGRDHLRVLTYFNHGGWCRWIAYEQDPDLRMKVTTDGRTQFVPVEDYEKSFDLYGLKYSWANTLLEWAPDVVLVDKKHALSQLLVRSRNSWSLVHEDQTFALFVPIAK